jgi:hypothetical protein
MGDLKMSLLSRRNHNWKVLEDLLFVLPFVPTSHVVETYENEILARIDDMKSKEANPFGSPAAEQKIAKFLAYVDKTWIGERVGLHGRTTGMYWLKRWNHFFDCLSGDAHTNNSSEGNFLILNHSFSVLMCWTVLRMHDILWWIRIRVSMPVSDGSGL